MAQIKLYMVHFLYGTDMAQIWEHHIWPIYGQSLSGLRKL